LAQLLWFRPRPRAFGEQLKRWERYVETNRGKLQEAEEN